MVEIQTSYTANIRSLASRGTAIYANQFPLNQKQRLGTQQEISEKGLVGGPKTVTEN